MVIAAHFEESTEPAGSTRDPRRTLRLAAEGLTESGQAAPVLIHNISATGLLLESGAPLAEGEGIDIDLPHAGATLARVVWTSERFFGCRFDEPISKAALSAAQLHGDRPAESDGPAPGSALGEESFGARLHRLRKQRGLTMSQLATQLGVSKPTVWAWEQGRARPVAGRLEALAQALEVSPHDVMSERGAAVLPDLILRARQQIAEVLGVAPEKIRITVDL